MSSVLRCLDLGSIPYQDAMDVQNRIQHDRLAGRGDDHLLLLEHPRVYTYGKRAGRNNLIWDPQELTAKGFALVETDRGGDITYHGPGQLVAYLIVALKGRERSVPELFFRVEGSVVKVLGSYGITARGGTQVENFTDRQDLMEAGVWVENDKICAVGMKLSRWVTSHGLALNVDPNLDDFQGIIPCGLAHRGVCSMAQFRASAPPMREVKAALAQALGLGLERTLRWAP